MSILSEIGTKVGTELKVLTDKIYEVSNSAKMFHLNVNTGGNSSVGANIPVPFNTVVINNDNIIELQSNGEAKILEDGLYIFSTMIFSNESLGNRWSIRKNNSTTSAFTSDNTNKDAVNFSSISRCVVGDLISLRVYSGSATWYGAGSHNSLQGVKL